MTDASERVAHAVWRVWSHIGERYRVRTRGSVSAFTLDGVEWTDSYGKPLARPAGRVVFHGGPLAGQFSAK